MSSATHNGAAEFGGRLFPNLGRRKTYEEVADEMRRLIFGRRLPPAHRLPTERELAEQFGVSRMAVREAIRMLERDGLLHVRKGPKGGLFVAQDYDRPINNSIANILACGEASVQDLFEIRRLLEPYAAARTAELASEQELAGLAELVRQAEADRDQGKSPRAHNVEFHRRILQMSRNPIMAVIGEAVLRLLADRIQAVVSRGTSEKALAMHKAILGALRKRQPRKASTLMAEEIEATGRRFARLSPEAVLQLAREPRART